jgi:rhodanese-related sulfurtransferase
VRPPSGVAYTHWVLFLGFDNDGRARLYDPPREFGSISVSELLSMWHGVGILVARQGENASVSVPLSFAFTAWVAGSALLIKLVPRCCQGWKLVVAVATILSGVAHLMLPTGFLRSPSSVNDVQAPFFAERVARLNFDETHRLINSEACYLVDARMRSAYADFHLPGAVNIPIDSGYLKLKREISRIDEGASVIVYCQSDSCSWAEQMAQQLAAGGVRKIYVYQVGVREWRAKASGT